jgi:hypothetical protein
MTQLVMDVGPGAAFAVTGTSAEAIPMIVAVTISFLSIVDFLSRPFFEQEKA